MIISRPYTNDDYVFDNVYHLLIITSLMAIVFFLLKHKNKVKLHFENGLNYILKLVGTLYYQRKLVVTKHKPSGLRNASAFCYMNSMIQAAAASDVFVSKLEQLQPENGKSESLTAFVELLDGINQSGNYNEMIDSNTEKMAELISLIGWRKSSQQDAFDLFAALIKAIQDELTLSGNVEIQMPLKVKLIHRFKGMDIPDKVQDHLGLSVGLCGEYQKRPGESLEYLIQEHFSPTIIDDDPSKTTQMFFYQQAPDVLLIHIQANKWDYERGEMYKPEYYIKYGNYIKLQLNIVTDTGDEKHDVGYKLKSVVKHSGTISGGHYVTYREYQGEWYLVNDEQVAATNFDSGVVPYIMIFEKTHDLNYNKKHIIYVSYNSISAKLKNNLNLFKIRFLSKGRRNNEILKII